MDMKNIFPVFFLSVAFLSPYMSYEHTERMIMKSDFFRAYVVSSRGEAEKGADPKLSVIKEGVSNAFATLSIK